jgi:hypothetical protein
MWNKVFQALEQPRYREIGQRYNRSRYCTVTGSFWGSAYINLQSARKGRKKLVPLPLPRPAKAARKVWVAWLRIKKECLITEIKEYTISHVQKTNKTPLNQRIYARSLCGFIETAEESFRAYSGWSFCDLRGVFVRATAGWEVGDLSEH